jgi:pyruvate dehydrogenase (quinone)
MPSTSRSVCFWVSPQRAIEPGRQHRQDLQDFPYAAYAESIGLGGIRCDKPAALGDAWERALASDRPVVLEAITDPDIFIFPPQIAFAQAKNYMTALA